MGALVPVVHGIEYAVWLVNNQNRTLGNQGKIRFSNHHDQFQNMLFFRIKPGHFHIDPNQTLFVDRHIIILKTSIFAHGIHSCSLCCS